MTGSLGTAYFIVLLFYFCKRKSAGGGPGAEPTIYGNCDSWYFQYSFLAVRGASEVLVYRFSSVIKNPKARLYGLEFPTHSGGFVLEKPHIDWYWQDILQAKRHAEGDIQTARLFAREMDCEGCEYCNYLDRHEKVLQETATDLVVAVDSLTPGMRAKQIFPRPYAGGVLPYRGFITPDGEYVSMWTYMDHDKCWQEYAQMHGKEKAYQLIKISGSFSTGRKALVMFSDRKAPPNEKQFETLRDLMIDAEGELTFRFVYDPSHPH